jgi:capsular polysaccharide biosynthesis protein
MNPPPLPASPTETPSKSGGFLIYSAVFIVTFILVYLATCVVTYGALRKFESTAVVLVKPSKLVVDPASIKKREYFTTEFEMICSQQNLKSVEQRLNLQSRWGMTEEKAVATLLESVDAQNIRGTDLILIKVTYTAPEDARDVAKEVAEVCRMRREEKERTIADNAIKELENAIAEQANSIEEKRKRLETLLKTKSDSDPMANLRIMQTELDLENQQDAVELIHKKLKLDRDNYKSVTEDVVIIVGEPRMDIIPVSPNVRLNLRIGAGIGVVLGVIFALLVRLLRGARH